MGGKLVLRTALFILLAAFGGVVASTRPADAESAPQAIDVLLLVDQSGSMGGERFGMPSSVVPQPNDPDGLRFEAPLAVLDILGLDRLGVHRASTYRFGVINFGGPTDAKQRESDYAEVTLPLTPVTPSTTAEWEATRRTIRPLLSEAPWLLARRNLGSTSFVEPFRLACSQFLSGSSKVDTRVVVLITDGLPDRPDVALDVSAHLEAVHEIVDRCDPLRSSQIHVVALKNSASPRYFDTVSGLWERVIGSASRVEMIFNNQQLHQKVASIISGVIPWGVRVEKQAAIGPLLDRVTFRILKTSQSDEVRIRRPATQQGASDSYVRCEAPVECTRTELSLAITIPFPESGLWGIEVASGRDVEVWKTEVPLTVVADTPPSLVQYAKTRVPVRLIAQNGQVWRPSSDARATLDWAGSALVDASGTTRPVDIDSNPDGFLSAVVPESTGMVRLQLRATASGFGDDLQPRRLQVVDTSIALGEVVTGTLARLEVTLEGQDGAEPNALHSSPFWLGDANARAVRVTIRTTSPSGVPLPSAQLIDSPGPVRLTVVEPSGRETTSEALPDRDGWQAILPMGLIGTWKVTASYAGPVRTRVVIRSSTPAEIERVEPEWRAEAQLAEGVLGGVFALFIAWHLLTFVALLRPPRLSGTLDIERVSGGVRRGRTSVRLTSMLHATRISGRRASGVALVVAQSVAVSGPGKARPRIRVARAAFDFPFAPAPLSVNGTELGDGETRTIDIGVGKAPRPGARPEPIQVRITYRAR